MLGLDRFLTLRVDRPKVIGFDLLSKEAHVIRECLVVFLQRQDIIGVLLDDGAGDVLLPTHGINGHEASPEVQERSELGNRRDLVGCVIDLQLTSDQPIGLGPRAHHGDGGLGGRTVQGATQGFAVHRHDLPLTALTEGLGPGEKTWRACVRIEACEPTAKRLVRRNAMGQVQQLSEPLGLRLALCCAIFPALRTTAHGTYRNDYHVQQAMASVGASGIGHVGKMIAKRDGRDAVHGDVSLSVEYRGVFKPFLRLRRS